jgi:hypothetical protein
MEYGQTILSGPIIIIIINNNNNLFSIRYSNTLSYTIHKVLLYNIGMKHDSQRSEKIADEGGLVEQSQECRRYPTIVLL